MIYKIYIIFEVLDLLHINHSNYYLLGVYYFKYNFWNNNLEKMTKQILIMTILEKKREI